METQVEQVGDVQVIHLRGRLDLATSPTFETMLRTMISGGQRKIVLDCSELKYISSSGLGAFIAAGKALGDKGKLVFSGLSKQLQSLFDMTGIANLFEICATQEEALGKFPAA